MRRAHLDGAVQMSARSAAVPASSGPYPACPWQSPHQRRPEWEAFGFRRISYPDCSSSKDRRIPPRCTRDCSAQPHQAPQAWANVESRSEEHTSELQSLTNLVCRLLLEKKKKKTKLTN